MQMANTNIVALDDYRENTEQMHIDDISAQAFLFLQEQAQEHNLPMRKLLLEHLLGVASVVKAVEGLDEAQNWLAYIGAELNDGTTH
jgi:hypothetical protein